LRPLDGTGDFYTSVDVISRFVHEDVLDVMVLVEVKNSAIKFEKEKHGLVGRMRLEVRLSSLDGEVVTRTRHVHTAPLGISETGSSLQFQVFGVLLRDVPFRAGRIDCVVFDANRHKRGAMNSIRKKGASSEASSAWAAPATPRPAAGVLLEEPLYLLQAPLAGWKPDVDAALDEDSDWLHDYAHPSRRYGLEQDHLQIYQPVWPPVSGLDREGGPAGLRVEVSSLDMDYVLRDTVYFDATGREALALGHPAGLFYSLDVNILPEGAYHLSTAPLGAEGAGSVTRFDVIWRLAALARPQELVLGEGRTVLDGRELTVFLGESPAEQQKMLAEFWDGLNPDRTALSNPVHLNFQNRLAYVQRFLGGFDEFGAKDDRGEVFLVLGAPDEIQRESMPMNFRDQDDARIKVYQRFAPDRDGVAAKGSAVGGSQTINPYKVVGGIPMPFSRGAERDRNKIVYSAAHNFPFELWEYDNGGNPLFKHQLADRGMGQRFLFVDATGTGEFVLESSNVMQLEE